jgi:hypothetical protein
MKQFYALSQRVDHLAASWFAGGRPHARVDSLARLSKRLGRSLVAEGNLVARRAGNRERGGAGLCGDGGDISR